MTRRYRVLAGVAGSFALLLAFVVIGEATGWPFLRGPLQRQLSRSANVPVLLEGDFSLGLIWRPHLTVGHLNVAPGAQLELPHLIDGRNIELQWRWGDLWRWHQGQPLRVELLRAAQLDARLVRTGDGRASWQLGQAPAVPPPPRSTQESLRDVPRFGLLAIESGHAEVDDRVLDTLLQIDLHGREGDTLSGKGKDGAAGYEATVKGRWRALPLQLQLRSGGSLPLLEDNEKQSAPMVRLRVEGKVGASSLTFDGAAAALLASQRLDGTLRFRGPSLAPVGAPLGITLPQTPPFELVGRLAHKPGVWQLRADRATIGSSQLEGEFSFETTSKPPRLVGRLGGSRLALADLGPAVGAPAPGQAASAASRTPGPRRVLPQRRFDLPSLRAMDADVQVAIAVLDFDSSAIAPLRDLRTHVVLQGGVLQLKDLQTVVAGGRISGDTSLNANAEPAHWAADLRLAQVDIAGWLRGVRAPAGQSSAAASTDSRKLQAQRQAAAQGGTQTVNSYITGELSGQVQVAGRGRSTAEILASLDGRASGSLQGGSLSHLLTEAAGLDLAQALGVWIRGDRPLPLRCARFDLAIREGVVRPRWVVLDNKDSTLRMLGQVDLRDESLALQAVVRPKDMSPLTLRTPIVVGGTLGAPTVSVNVGQVAGKAAAAVALGTLIAPLAALIPLFDLGTRDEGDPCVSAPKPAAAGRAATR